MDRFREEECAQGFTAFENLTDPVALRDSLKRDTLDAAQKSIGEHLMTRQNFISLETLEVIVSIGLTEWHLGFVPWCTGLRLC